MEEAAATQGAPLALVAAQSADVLKRYGVKEREFPVPASISPELTASEDAVAQEISGETVKIKSKREPSFGTAVIVVAKSAGTPLVTLLLFVQSPSPSGNGAGLVQA